MRTLFFTLCTILMIGLLSGCSLPIGDGLLTVSSEGVNFVKGENNEKDLAEGDEDGAMPANTQTEVEDANEQDAKNNVRDIEDVANGAESNADNGNTLENEQATERNNNCEKQDHSRVLKQIGNDFYIPDCAVITSQTFSENEVSVYFDLADAHWEDIADDYRDKLPQDGFNDSTNFESKTALIYFQQYGADSDSSYITIEQKDKGEEGEEDYEKNVFIHAVIRK